MQQKQLHTVDQFLLGLSATLKEQVSSEVSARNKPRQTHQTDRAESGAVQGTGAETIEGTKASLTTFFIRSSMMGLVHWLQSTWQAVSLQPTPLGLSAARSCHMLLNDGLSALRSLPPAALAPVCTKEVLWKDVLAKACVEVASLYCAGSPVITASAPYQ